MEILWQTTVLIFPSKPAFLPAFSNFQDFSTQDARLWTKSSGTLSPPCPPAAQLLLASTTACHICLLTSPQACSLPALPLTWVVAKVSRPTLTLQAATRVLFLKLQSEYVTSYLAAPQRHPSLVVESSYCPGSRPGCASYRLWNLRRVIYLLCVSISPSLKWER